MSLLESINRGKSQKPPRLLIYGSEGIGKSSLGAAAPKPVFIPTEDGLDNIDCASFPLCKTFTDLQAALQTLINETHDFKTVVLDTADWAEKLIWEHICNQTKPAAKSIAVAEGGYGKGYERAAAIWQTDIIKKMRTLRDEKNMAIIILAHANIGKHNDPETGEFSRFSPHLHKDASRIVCEWCDAVLLATREFGAAKGDIQGGARVLRCTPSAVGVAKNRYGFPDILPLSWNAISQGIYQPQLTQ